IQHPFMLVEVFLKTSNICLHTSLVYTHTHTHLQCDSMQTHTHTHTCTLTQTTTRNQKNYLVSFSKIFFCLFVIGFTVRKCCVCVCVCVCVFMCVCVCVCV